MVKGERMTKIQVQVRNWVGFILAKPFEWIMRISYVIHLNLDGNSEWFCMNQNQLNEMCEEYVKDFGSCNNCEETGI